MGPPAELGASSRLVAESSWLSHEVEECCESRTTVRVTALAVLLARRQRSAGTLSKGISSAMRDQILEAPAMTTPHVSSSTRRFRRRHDEPRSSQRGRHGWLTSEGPASIVLGGRTVGHETWCIRRLGDCVYPQRGAAAKLMKASRSLTSDRAALRQTSSWCRAARPRSPMAREVDESLRPLVDDVARPRCWPRGLIITTEFLAVLLGVRAGRTVAIAQEPRRPKA